MSRGIPVRYVVTYVDSRSSWATGPFTSRVKADEAAASLRAVGCLSHISVVETHPWRDTAAFYETAASRKAAARSRPVSSDQAKEAT